MSRTLTLGNGAAARFAGAAGPLPSLRKQSTIMEKLAEAARPITSAQPDATSLAPTVSGRVTVSPARWRRPSGGDFRMRTLVAMGRILGSEGEGRGSGVSR